MSTSTTVPTGSVPSAGLLDDAIPQARTYLSLIAMALMLLSPVSHTLTQIGEGGSSRLYSVKLPPTNRRPRQARRNSPPHCRRHSPSLWRCAGCCFRNCHAERGCRGAGGETMTAMACLLRVAGWRRRLQAGAMGVEGPILGCDGTAVHRAVRACAGFGSRIGVLF